MLTKLILENYRSYKNRTEFDFKKTKYEQLPGNCADNGVLKGAVFIGGNATGKSNVIKALRLLLDILVGESYEKLDLLPWLPGNNKNTLCEYHFVIGDDELKYSFVHDLSVGFIEERLMLNDRQIFLRDKQGAKAEITIGVVVEYLAENIKADSSALRKLYFDSQGFIELPAIKKWFDFLRNSVYFNPLDKEVHSYSGVDFNFVEYYVKNKANYEIVNKVLEQIKYSMAVSIVFNDESNPLEAPSINNIFMGRQDAKLALPIKYESDGNKTLLKLIPCAYHVIANRGMLLIDEFSSGLHNALEKVFIDYFMKNAGFSQLFLVTHSTNILTTATLRPDQIFIINYKLNEGSEYARVSSASPRFAQNIEKMYLSGIFADVPAYAIDTAETQA